MKPTMSPITNVPAIATSARTTVVPNGLPVYAAYQQADGKREQGHDSGETLGHARQMLKCE